AMACGTPVAAYHCQGPVDVIDQGLTGFMVTENESLVAAVEKCLELDREQVLRGSRRWSWEAAWHIFKNNLV
ncbi:MAG: glycosyltransferase, partial [Chitinophagia bacterium]|nr:glycosyltransferase [Chitinophagia bacterium]